MINGFVAEESRRRGRPAPANASVNDIVRRIELGMLTPSPANMDLARTRHGGG